MSKIKLSENFIRNIVKLALNEDLYPSGDITSDLIQNNRSNISSIAWMNLIFAALLLVAYKLNSNNKNLIQLTLVGALCIGFFQVFSLLPGASRSGTAITAALFIGLNLKDASKFSFMLAIPTILGAIIFLIGVFLMRRCFLQWRPLTQDFMT